jgi:hypothetical protein
MLYYYVKRTISLKYLTALSLVSVMFCIQKDSNILITTDMKPSAC